MSLRLDPPPSCCGRPGKLARREWPTHPRSWMECYRCPRCGKIMLPYPVDGAAHLATLDAIRIAGMEFDESLTELRPEDMSPRRLA